MKSASKISPLVDILPDLVNLAMQTFHRPESVHFSEEHFKHDVT